MFFFLSLFYFQLGLRCTYFEFVLYAFEWFHFMDAFKNSSQFTKKHYTYKNKDCQQKQAFFFLFMKFV